MQRREGTKEKKLDVFAPSHDIKLIPIISFVLVGIIMRDLYGRGVAEKEVTCNMDARLVDEMHSRLWK